VVYLQERFNPFSDTVSIVHQTFLQVNLRKMYFKFRMRKLLFLHFMKSAAFSTFKIYNLRKKFIMGRLVSGHLPEKLRHFVFS